jgi:hypothetical protein
MNVIQSETTPTETPNIFVVTGIPVGWTFVVSDGGTF